MNGNKLKVKTPSYTYTAANILNVFKCLQRQFHKVGFREELIHPYLLMSPVKPDLKYRHSWSNYNTDTHVSGQVWGKEG